MNLIFFNGPPSSGKDTAAMHLYRKRHELPGTVRFDRMSMPNKRAFAGMTNTYHLLNQFGINRKYEPIKDQPLPELGGKSYRQWQIDFSQTLMKPLYGEDIFAMLFYERIQCRENDAYTYVVPDCGFSIEATTIRILLPNARLLMVRLSRPDTDFSKDSRSYVPSFATRGWDELSIHNDKTIDKFEDIVWQFCREWIK